MPERFAGATGRGVRIAVIDSGVHPAHPHIGRLAGGAAVARDGSIVEGLSAAIDRLGHGTAAMAAIQEKAPDADCFAVRVFDDALSTRASVLAAAIDWSIDAGMQLINLSLGTTNAAHRALFMACVERAAAAGCVLVAARSADGAACWPGALPGVLGVDLDWDCPRERCRHDGIRFAGSGYPRPAPGVPPVRNLHGISFAVANLTGLAARAVERLGGLPPGDPLLPLTTAMVDEAAVAA